MPDTVFGVTSSAAGKVMLIGGYLVLERPNKGLILSVSAKVHSSVYQIPPTHEYKTSLNIPANSFPILLLTPQITGKNIELYATVDRTVPEDPTIELHGMVYANKFVTITLQHTLSILLTITSDSYFHGLTSHGLIIHVYGDAPFYTSRTDIDGYHEETIGFSTNNLPIKSFVRCNPAEFKTKTGLGSSAALVSSLTSALFGYFGILPTDGEINQTDNITQLPIHKLNALREKYSILNMSSAFRLVYEATQFAHCAAQGKVGSGFDVAACYYGNQTYCRFSPAILEPLFQYAPGTYPSGNAILNHLGPFAQVPWDDESKPFELPRGLQLLLADVHGGSETPGMVRSILQWRDSNPSNQEYWKTVGEANEHITPILEQLIKYSKEHAKDYDNILNILGSLPSSKWNWQTLQESIKQTDHNDITKQGIELFEQLSDAFSAARKKLFLLGEYASVPIEPLTQTQLLDDIRKLNGVVGVGVPGAGGYDASYALFIENSEVDKIMEKKWKESDLQVLETAHVSKLPVKIEHGRIYLTKAVRKIDF